MIKLIFNKKYKSIDSFSPVEIEDLTVITWLNWAWKTHLLEAIRYENITIEWIQRSDIVYFNYNNFLLDNEWQHSWQSINQEKNWAWDFFNQQIKGMISSYRTDLWDNYNKILEICNEKDKGILELNNDDFIEKSEDLKNQYQNYKNNILNFFKDRHRWSYQAKSILILFRKLNYSIDEINQEVFFRKIDLYQLKDDFLPTQLWRIIWNYYFKYKENKVNQFENTQDWNTEIEYLEDKDFIALYWKKPWEIINEILKEFSSMNYKLKSPETTWIHWSYQLKLMKDDIEVDFSNLSSGEKTLMALVATIYKTNSDNYFPKLLLLDEIDSSLHPSMTKSLLNVIKNVFIKNWVKVIFVTHSPSTIALSPDNSIRLLNRTWINLIEPINKEKAIWILSEWFLIVKENQKNVLVEWNWDDKRFYESIYRQLIKFWLNDNIWINFISAWNWDNDWNGSCTKIKRFIEQVNNFWLKDYLLWLVDNDNSDEELPDKVFRLNRYSFENYKYDPIFIFGLLINDDYNDEEFLNLLEDLRIPKFNYQKLNELDENALNKITLFVCNKIKTFNSLEGINESLENIEYINWKKCRIPNWFLTTKWHDLEAKIPNSFKNGNKVLITPKKLEDYSDRLPWFISKDIFEVFIKIQNYNN